jgi:hypothetical protein
MYPFLENNEYIDNIDVEFYEPITFDTHYTVYLKIIYTIYFVLLTWWWWGWWWWRRRRRRRQWCQKDLTENCIYGSHVIRLQIDSLAGV